MLSTKNTLQVMVEATWLVQKNEVSTGLGLNSLLWLENFQISFPF